MRRKARLVISSVGLGALLAGVALGASGARAKASTGEGTAPIDRVERIRAALLDHDRRQAGGDARDSLDPVAAQVSEIETVQTTTASTLIGSVRTSGPAGVNRPDCTAASRRWGWEVGGLAGYQFGHIFANMLTFGHGLGNRLLLR